MSIFQRVDRSPDWNQLCPEWYIDFDAPQPRRRWEFNVNKHDVAVNEKVVFTAKLFEDDCILAGEPVKLTLTRDFHDNETWEAVTTKEGLRVETSLEKPGFLRLMAEAKGASRAYGAAVDAAQIEPAPEVEGFAEYWNGRIQALHGTPLEVKKYNRVHPAEESEYPGTETYSVSVTCAGPHPVEGLLSLPSNATPGSLPAYLFLHGAGIRPPFPPLPWAKLGALAFNISALAIPWETTAEELAQFKKTYAGYPQIAPENPLDSPFDGMALRVLRALEYLKSRPEWDHKHLVVHGGSQGGWQSLVATAFDHDVTYAQIEAPAQCNVAGALQGRTPSWPGSIQKNSGDTPRTRILRLFDGTSFARHSVAPVVFTSGYSDGAAVPSSIYATYNAYAGKQKTFWAFPDLGHELAVFWSGATFIREHLGI
ncbi:MAG: acetylxylan esterase [Victivallales bacterium]|nr:acetylxylan esterase [Victivallales bacterium]